MVAPLKLYELGDAYQKIVEQAIENGGEITPELALELDAIGDAFAVKAERTALYIRNLIATATAAQVEADRLRGIAGSADRAVEGLKRYLFDNMQRVGQTQIKTPLISIRIQRNSQPSVSSTLPEDYTLPVWCRRITYSLDKGAVVAAWKADPTSLPTGVTISVGSHLRVQ